MSNLADEILGIGKFTPRYSHKCPNCGKTINCNTAVFRDCVTHSETSSQTVGKWGVGYNRQIQTTTRSLHKTVDICRSCSDKYDYGRTFCKIASIITLIAGLAWIGIKYSWIPVIASVFVDWFFYKVFYFIWQGIIALLGVKTWINEGDGPELYSTIPSSDLIP